MEKVHEIKTLVNLLLESYEDHAEIIKVDTGDQLNRSVIIETIDKLRALIFPGYFGKKNISTRSVEYYAGDLLEDIFFTLRPQIARSLNHSEEYQGLSDEIIDAKAEEITFAFLAKLPEIRNYLADDVTAAFDGDPAAFSRDEIISSYPGIYAIAVNRLAHVLYDLRVPLIPRIMTEHAHSVTGIDIHPGASIGHHFFIDHGTGIVIGETTTIGNFVKIYQGVTLGALSTRGGQVLKDVKRHPTIEDHVTIYSGASILGGATVVGEGVVIGSNAFVTKSVPEKTKVSVKNPELQFKTDKQHYSEPQEFQQAEFWDWVI
ncbi:serine O-acetyltransferase EpsC [Leadbettera azotonutricia]|uniref:Serine O-acetyltransferase n=1 Tax=Leadbettera azotonutricia (strain ATCC BAA-888 / DSM 13862 / ZAS-9) TaxID=545695 RepID=F5YDE9_LEAAZ|nr:serine O-acetyltransferase EpsC [Leadbettera azotonutricia]AEF80275.1 serine O-acetyltransferase [Leadbettera azotonutricia ZAS-9]